MIKNKNIFSFLRKIFSFSDIIKEIKEQDRIELEKLEKIKENDNINNNLDLINFLKRNKDRVYKK